MSTSGFYDRPARRDRPSTARQGETAALVAEIRTIHDDNYGYGALRV